MNHPQVRHGMKYNAANIRPEAGQMITSAPWLRRP
jgi:hypothetical protein